MIPEVIEEANGGIAAAASHLNKLHDAARRAGNDLRALERQHALAERDDVRVQGEASATGKRLPKRTAPDLAAQLAQAKHEAEVAAAAAVAGTRLFGRAVVAEHAGWLSELDQAHVAATADLRAALDAAATAADAISVTRNARSWLAAAVAEFTAPNGHGRVPTQVAHDAAAAVRLGSSSWGYSAVLDALAAWARPHEPEPPAAVPCRFCGVPFRPTDDSDFCQPRCEHSARARAVQIEEQQANSTRVAG